MNREQIWVDFSFVVEALLDKEQRSCGFATSASKSGALAGCMLFASTSTQRMLTACMPLLSLATGRETAMAFQGGKARKRLFFPSKRNDGQTRHDFVMAVICHLMPMAARKSVGRFWFGLRFG